MEVEVFNDFSRLKAGVALFMAEGWRLVQILAQKAPPLVPGVLSVGGGGPNAPKNDEPVPSGAVELTYSFARDREFQNLRATAHPNQPIPSISELCIGAFLYENEINELFGLKIEGIVIDYKGTMYKTAEKRAFNPEVARG